jgi:hypothetical protein
MEKSWVDYCWFAGELIAKSFFEPESYRHDCDADINQATWNTWQQNDNFAKICPHYQIQESYEYD